MSRFLLELDGEPHDVLRLLRHLLRRLGRDHGVRCRAIMPIADAEGAP
jgi:hypothetical protein